MSQSRSKSPGRAFGVLVSTLLNAISTLDMSLSPALTISRLRAHSFVFSDAIYLFHLINATFWLVLMQKPAFPAKLLIPILYTTALLIPLTSQFFVPATPIFAWLITYYSSRFIPTAYRPEISVSLLPTLETVLYGANISDILTRFTHPVLDIIAWLPYGVGHFSVPFFVAAALWLFAPKPALRFWADVFGYMNLIGVICQILFPCSPPWYELIYGLTPADYSMHGSPGGLARIDALFHSKGYTATFSNAPVVFGAFPSLHAGNSTLMALVVSHFFPDMAPYVWGYTAVMYWATMYLTHHYLIDVVGGACLATAFFYLFLPASLAVLTPAPRNKHELYDLEAPRAASRASLDSHDGEEEDIAYRSPAPTGAAAPFIPTRGHRHTASIASLIRSEERVEDGWSPVGQAFVLPPTPASVPQQVVSTAGNRDGGLRGTMGGNASAGGGITRSRSPSQRGGT